MGWVGGNCSGDEQGLVRHYLCQRTALNFDGSCPKRALLTSSAIDFESHSQYHLAQYRDQIEVSFINTFALSFTTTTIPSAALPYITH
jgi:hypothetical protein